MCNHIVDPTRESLYNKSVERRHLTLARKYLYVCIKNVPTWNIRKKRIRSERAK